VPNPVSPFLQNQGFLILDGGLATELEARGKNISDPLWSAKVLVEDPDFLRTVHYDYLVSGADCIVSASYQATVEGFVRRGLSEWEATSAMRLSVKLAVEARDLFWEKQENRKGRLRPLVASSVGPYGAYLADGSEYDGRYGLSRADLVAFHRDRWFLLADCGADLLACETIPSLSETHALLDLLRETPDKHALFSFSCRDAETLHDGNRLADALTPLSRSEQVVAVGANCVPPSLVAGLIRTISGATSKPVMVYPNSGESWNAESKTWYGTADPVDFAAASSEWYRSGATVIGGCCRTGPEHVRAMRSTLEEESAKTD